MKYVKLKDVENLLKNQQHYIVGNDGYSDQQHHALLNLKNKLKTLKVKKCQ